MSASWQEHSLLILETLKRHGEQLTAIEKKCSPVRAIMWGALAGALAAVLISAPHGASLLSLAVRALSM